MQLEGRRITQLGSMYLAYFDESGDTGAAGSSPSTFYVIACVLVRDIHWNKALDLLVRIRKRMKAMFGIATTPEIKATDFRRGRGPLLHLGWSVQRRAQLFTQLLGWEHRLGLNTFAVAVDKRTLQAGRDPREVAWHLQHCHLLDVNRLRQHLSPPPAIVRYP